ncbi:MAG: hypothetical protein CVU38_01505 [Chloroflexi bacterium HGW-Chloroflexi-1]|nr:MAG: hypothetical protein CVU38_01505 [Chloroflexi bacterium HGW-Chloroflexi-1]
MTSEKSNIIVYGYLLNNPGVQLRRGDLRPNTDFLPAEIERDRGGFLVTSSTLETTMPGMFAAGDVRAGSTKQAAAAAAGEGATAASMIREYLRSQQ